MLGKGRGRCAVVQFVNIRTRSSIVGGLTHIITVVLLLLFIIGKTASLASNCAKKRRSLVNFSTVSGNQSLNEVLQRAMRT